MAVLASVIALAVAGVSLSTARQSGAAAAPVPAPRSARLANALALGVPVGAVVRRALHLPKPTSGRGGAAATVPPGAGLSSPAAAAAAAAERAAAAPTPHHPPLRPAYAAAIGILSRPVTPRRDVVRATWMADRASLEAAGVYARFVVGTPPPGGTGAAAADPGGAIEAALAQEAAVHGDLLRVPTTETYDSLLLKVLAFFKAAVAAVDAAYYVKTDDDVYVRADRLPAAVAQWGADGAGYTGCMFLGGDMIADPASTFYEPHGPLFAGRRYAGYMSGGFYGLSAQAAAWLGAKQPDTVRLMGCGEDCSVGLQMLALPVRIVEDWRVCSHGCRNTSIGERVESGGEGEVMMRGAVRRAVRRPRARAGAWWWWVVGKGGPRSLSLSHPHPSSCLSPSSLSSQPSPTPAMACATP